MAMAWKGPHTVLVYQLRGADDGGLVIMLVAVHVLTMVPDYWFERV